MTWNEVNAADHTGIVIVENSGLEFMSYIGPPHINTYRQTSFCIDTDYHERFKKKPGEPR